MIDTMSDEDVPDLSFERDMSIEKRYPDNLSLDDSTCPMETERNGAHNVSWTIGADFVDGQVALRIAGRCLCGYEDVGVITGEQDSSGITFIDD